MGYRINENKTSIVPFQSGSGAPNHLSFLGTVYVDNLTGIQYINKDGLANWAYLLDSSMPISGGTGSGGTITGAYLPLSGGTVTGPTIFTGGVSANTLSNVQWIDFSTAATVTQATGRVFYDIGEQSLAYYPDINQAVTVKVGQQLYVRVYNVSGAVIPKGSVVSVTGTSNNLPSVTLSKNNHEITSARPIGLSADNIPNNNVGLVITNGILSGITLNNFNNGDTLYLSPFSAGTYVSNTATFPFTARTNEIGYVIQTGTTTGKIYVTINNEDSNLSLTDIERNILEGNVVSSGAYQYTGITLGTGQTINISALKGWIVKNTYDYATLPDVTNINYTGGTNIPLTYLSAASATYLLINSASTLTQQITFPTPQERRQNIFIGKVVHPNKTTITSLNQTVDFDVSPMAAIRDLWTPIKLINQGIVPSAYSAGTLSIKTSAGIIWGNGIGWTTNQLNPDSVSLSATSPTTFQYRTATGGTFSNTTAIDSHNYDPSGLGVLTAIPGSGNFTTQRIYQFPTGLIRIQYGQEYYPTQAKALAGLSSEQYIEYVNNRDNGILIGFLTVKEGLNDLTNTGDAFLTYVSKFGELFGGTAGISTTTLQQAYDNSTTPEIVINSTLDGLTIKNGTGNADNITHILETQNAAGSVTSFITADGTFSGSTLITPSFRANANGLTATTVSATTYLNLPLDIRTTGATYSNNTFTYTNNTGGTYSVLFNTLTGLTVNGVLSASTISGGTFYGNGSGFTNFTSGQITTALGYTPYNNTNPNGYITGYTNTYTTGGTYSAGTLTLKDNSNNNISVSGFSTGITAINNLTNGVQTIVTGNTGTDFNIVSSGSTHTFNLPTASGTNRGLLSSSDWTIFNNKISGITNVITGTGVSNAVAFYNNTNSITGTTGFTYNGNLGIGTTAPAKPLHIITTGGTQIRAAYDLSYYLDINCGGGGITTFNITNAGGTPYFSFNKPVIGSFQTDNNAVNGNFASVSSYNASSSYSITDYLIGTATTMNVKTSFYGSGGATLGSDNSFSNVIIASTSVIKTGINQFVNSLTVKPIGLTTGSGTILNTATVYIDGASTGGTNNYSLYINSGNTYFGSSYINVPSGSTISAATGAKLQFASNGGVLINSTNNQNLQLGAAGSGYVWITASNGLICNNIIAPNTQLQVAAGAGQRLVFASNNTEQMRITSSGNVLIGTTTDLGYKLQVNGTTSISGSELNSGAYGSVTVNAGSSAGMITVSGCNTIGGASYVDFLMVTNTFTGATTPSKTFRLNGSGGLEIIDNVYTANTFTLTNSGNLTIGGSLTIPNRPAFRVSGSSVTGIAATTTITGTQGAVIDYNQGGYYNNTTGIFTASIAGLYQVYLNLRTQSAGTQQAIIVKNTSTNMIMWETNSNTGHFGVSGIIYLSVNDTLKVNVTVGTVQFDSNDSWGAAYIG